MSGLQVWFLRSGFWRLIEPLWRNLCLAIALLSESVAIDLGLYKLLNYVMSSSL